eukprot:gene10973-biopygen10872
MNTRGRHPSRQTACARAQCATRRVVRSQLRSHCHLACAASHPSSSRLRSGSAAQRCRSFSFPQRNHAGRELSLNVTRQCSQATGGTKKAVHLPGSEAEVQGHDLRKVCSNLSCCAPDGETAADTSRRGAVHVLPEVTLVVIQLAARQLVPQRRPPRLIPRDPLGEAPVVAPHRVAHAQQGLRPAEGTICPDRRGVQPTNDRGVTCGCATSLRGREVPRVFFSKKTIPSGPSRAASRAAIRFLAHARSGRAMIQVGTGSREASQRRSRDTLEYILDP